MKDLKDRCSQRGGLPGEGAAPARPPAGAEGSESASGGAGGGWSLTWRDRIGLTALSDLWRALGRKRVLAGAQWRYTAGTLAFFFFGLQWVTGGLLLARYVPRPHLAERSLDGLSQTGQLLRSLHAWGGTFIVLSFLILLLVSIGRGTYKKPREVLWLTASALGLLALLAALTGAHLAGTAASRVRIDALAARLSELPGVGEWIGARLRAASDSGFGGVFAIHVIALPLLFAFLSLGYLVLSFRFGCTPRVNVSEEQRVGHEESVRQCGAEPLVPGQGYRYVMASAVGLALLASAAAFWPVTSRAGAPPPLTPDFYLAPIHWVYGLFDRPEGLPGWLRLWPASGSLLATTLLIVALLVVVLLPLLDRTDRRDLRRRPFFATLLFLFLIALGASGVVHHIRSSASRETVSAVGAEKGPAREVGNGSEEESSPEGADRRNLGRDTFVAAAWLVALFTCVVVGKWLRDSRRVEAVAASGPESTGGRDAPSAESAAPESGDSAPEPPPEPKPSPTRRPGSRAASSSEEDPRQAGGSEREVDAERLAREGDERGALLSPLDEPDAEPEPEPKEKD